LSGRDGRNRVTGTQVLVGESAVFRPEEDSDTVVLRNRNEFLSEISGIGEGRALRADPGGGADHIVKVGEGLIQILEDLHLFHNVNGSPCGHPEDPGQVATLRMDQDEAPDSHVVHGPGHSTYVFGDLRLYKNNGNMLKVEGRHPKTINTRPWPSKRKNPRKFLTGMLYFNYNNSTKFLQM